MSEQQLEIITINQTYPFELPLKEGAVSDFLRPSSNRLLIAMPEISSFEAKLLRKGEVHGGLLVKNGAILFVWQFREKGQPVITLDSPFDARVIPDIQFYNVDSTETRLMIDIHIVDSASKIVRGLRSITIPPEMTLEFLSAVQEQIVNRISGDEQYQEWLAMQPNELTKRTKMWPLGK